MNIVFKFPFSKYILFIHVSFKFN